MAEEKKPEKKEGDAPKDPFVEIVFIVIALFAVIYFLNAMIGWFRSVPLFSGGVKDISERGILLSYTKPISSRTNPIGSRVVSTDTTAVYTTPGGTQKVGTQPLGAQGKIIQGPVEVNGIRYWYVDYDSGPDGWVREDSIGYMNKDPGVVERFIIKILSSLGFLKLLSIFITLILCVWMAYLLVGVARIRAVENALLYPAITPDEPVIINHKWQRILAHIDSQNEGDWRLAILEADIMLDDLLDKLELPGETMGDKLKAIEKSDFTTLDNAWEAHKIRNQIAHEGVDFMLNQREARRVIELYRTVFEEFQII